MASPAISQVILERGASLAQLRLSHEQTLTLPCQADRGCQRREGLHPGRTRHGRTRARGGRVQKLPHALIPAALRRVHALTEIVRRWSLFRFASKTAPLVINVSAETPRDSVTAMAAAL